MAGLTRQDIYKVVTGYIGGQGGYLGDFSYRTHHEFYPQYCGLDIDVESYRPGTTRDIFIRVLEDASPQDQAKIVRGVLDKYPVESFPEQNRALKSEIRAKLEESLRRLNGEPAVPSPDLKNTSDVVRRAIADVEALIRANGPVSGVDRIHTSLHGHLLAICRAAGLPTRDDPSATELLKTIIKTHPHFQTTTPRMGDTESILKALAVIIDALNPIRNRSSVAHPNDTLLDEPEATLVINTARTILHYLDARLG